MNIFEMKSLGIIGVVTIVLWIIISVMIHELGHFLTLKKYHVQVQEIGLGIPLPRGTFTFEKRGIVFKLSPLLLAAYVKVTDNEYQTKLTLNEVLLVDISGCLMNFGLALFSYFLLLLCRGINCSDTVIFCIKQLIVLNFELAVWNLFVFFPFTDGGHAVNLILQRKTKFFMAEGYWDDHQVKIIKWILFIQIPMLQMLSFCPFIFRFFENFIKVL